MADDKKLEGDNETFSKASQVPPPPPIPKASAQPKQPKMVVVLHSSTNEGKKQESTNSDKE